MLRISGVALGGILALVCLPASAQVQPSAPIASKGYVDSAVSTKAPLASPSFTGTVNVTGSVNTSGTIAAGTLSGSLTPSTFASGVTQLPQCTPGSAIAPVPTGQPFACGGLVLIAQ